MERSAVIAGLDVVATSPAWCVARGPHVYAVVLDGTIDDEQAATWQRITLANVTALGYPPYGFVVSSAKSETSLASRMRTAAFVRTVAAQLRELYVVTDTHQSFVIHSIMRVAGITNVQFVAPAEAPAVLATIIAGRALT